MKCLVTKLNGVVNNDSILKMGEMSITFSKTASPNKVSQGINIYVTNGTDLRIIGDGYFTDSTLEQNLGKTKHLDGEVQEDVYVSNGNFDLAISSKYGIRLLNIVPWNTSNATKNDLANKVFDLSELSYTKRLAGIAYPNSAVTGDISCLKNCVEIQSINVSNTSITGDISTLAGMVKLNALYISNTSIKGDISVFRNCVKLVEVFALNAQIFGDISVFANTPEISTLQLRNATGDIASLSTCSKLRFFETLNGNVTGDLAKLPNSVAQANFHNTSSSLSWNSERSSDAYILAINGSPKITNIDAMLINQAKCTIGSGQSTESKNITATGTRTSASDNAVAALQAKGYTVSVTPA